MSFLFEVIGYAGTFLSVLVYVPQIRHLLQEQYSAGISTMAVVIIVMQVANLLAVSTILIFAKKYQGRFCPSHAPK